MERFGFWFRVLVWVFVCMPLWLPMLLHFRDVLEISVSFFGLKSLFMLRDLLFWKQNCRGTFTVIRLSFKL